MAQSLGIFDAHHPPSGELISDCVHCGFCLPTCPTYALWGEEMDSPRGRIQLMSQGLSGEPMSDSMVTHFDRCLGCMACVPACPSGVKYDKLIEATRAQVERNHTRSPAERALREAIFALLPAPRRRGVRGAAGGYLLAVPVPAAAAAAARAPGGVPAHGAAEGDPAQRPARPAGTD